MVMARTAEALPRSLALALPSQVPGLGGPAGLLGGGGAVRMGGGDPKAHCLNPGSPEVHDTRAGCSG